MAVPVSCKGGGDGSCPSPTVDAEPQAIPPGTDSTTVFVAFTNPDPDNGRPVITKLRAESGTFDDRFAEITTYTCAHDVIGPVELCADATYGPPEDSSENASVQASYDYLRRTHVVLANPDECLETDCITVVCPEVRNVCPDISSLTAIPEVIPEGETSALVQVIAEDPDDNPEPLVTMLMAEHGTFVDPYASQSVYTCDPEVGGEIAICAVASDGDETCDQKLCITVECPGAPPDNICPVVQDLNATPNPIPPGQSTTLIEVEARDPDDQPEPLVTTLAAPSGWFDDPNALTTTFTCGDRGPVEVCVVASDGDETCPIGDRMQCIAVECPSTVNRCAELTGATVSPLQVAVGFHIDVAAEAVDDDGHPIDFRWSSIRGSFADPTANTTTYRCELVGDDVIAVQVSDDGFELCRDSWQTVVTCAPAPP
jgi:hypothetical protein